MRFTIIGGVRFLWDPDTRLLSLIVVLEFALPEGMDVSLYGICPGSYCWLVEWGIAAKDGGMNRHETEVRILQRHRPRSRFLRMSFVLTGLFVICLWFSGDFSTADVVSPRRLQNFQRFMDEATLYPLQQGESGILVVWH